MNGEKKTASYEIVKTKKGNVYRFFCEVSGAKGSESSPLNIDDPQKELMLAWEEGEENFNRCHKCGRWVLDVMYNPDVFNCVQCSPIEDIPDYCPKCGKKITCESVAFCPECGVKLMYGGESDEDM